MVIEPVSERLPLALPSDMGANIRFRVTVLPAASVSGREGPRRLNPGPDTIAWETVKSDLLELLKISACDAEVPVGTFPKLTLAGLTASCPLAMFVQQSMFRRRSTATFDQQKRFTASPHYSAQTRHGGCVSAALDRPNLVVETRESFSIWIVVWILKCRKITGVNSGTD